MKNANHSPWLRGRSGSQGAYGAHRASPPHALVTTGVLIALAMAFICTVALYQSRVDAMERATETARNLALLAERDIERNFELYALSLQAVVDGVGDPEVMGATHRLRNIALFDRAATASYLGSFLVLDAQGNIAIDAANEVPRKGNFSDRAYFQVHRDSPSVGLYVGQPYASRLRAGALTIPLSRRLSHADGSFAGVALLTVQLEYFYQLFASLSLGAHGSVALMRTDGTMIMRQPYDVQVIGRDIRNTRTFTQFTAAAEGSFSEASSIAGVRRLYYFKNLPNLPLIIMVAEAHSDIYAVWWHRALILAAVMGVLTAAFIGLSFAFGVQLQRRIRAESELAKLARTDALTGLHNRHTLGEILDQEWRRAERTGSMFSVLFVDIDWFKLYNDTYGHQAGDAALAAVAHCIAENIRRPIDSASRYGGEEFLVVLPDTSPQGAQAVAENIRQAVAILALAHTGSPLGHVTTSIGAATWTPGLEVGVSEIIRAADEALYCAKAAGRNQVHMAATHQPQPQAQAAHP